MLGVQSKQQGAASEVEVFARGCKCSDSLGAYAAMLPGRALHGKRLLELGAGPGAPSLFAAHRGAHCVITDVRKIVPLINTNIDSNCTAIRDTGVCLSSQYTTCAMYCSILHDVRRCILPKLLVKHSRMHLAVIG